ncbi:unnamed protein product [Diabrotica balteata]|uniref:TMEM205-like domain-containing protein n=1 Tax=Diabrotica balteata TaxID=107213 RepID=A0A9N9XDQ8_DIABA|nr:unnamed protein product [Diabrotica balteata]
MCIRKVYSESDVSNESFEEFEPRFPSYRFEFEVAKSVDTSNKNADVDDQDIREGVEPDNALNKESGGYDQDILSISTKYIQDLFQFFKKINQMFIQSYVYKILLYKTQPAHLITTLFVIIAAYIMMSEKAHPKTSPIWNLVYLGTFSAHFGAQIWMTFISGLALFFSLSRHTFGSVQQVLFPKYFYFNSILSFITFVAFIKFNNGTIMRSWEVLIQATSITLCLLVELTVGLYLTSPLLGLLRIKIGMEKEAGVGLEVGRYELGALKDCPHYMKIHKKFRKVHMTIAILNLIAMACNTLHLYYLSQKICFC